MLCRFKLRPAGFLNQRRDLVHQFWAKPQISGIVQRCLRWRPKRWCSCGFGFGHLMPLIMKLMGDIIKTAKTGVVHLHSNFIDHNVCSD